MLWLESKSRRAGWGVPHLFQDDLVRFPIVVPPRSEQYAITAFLDRETAKIDALVEEQRRLIELLNEKRQAVISHSITKGLDPDVSMKDSGVEWLGNLPVSWSVADVKRLVSLATSGPRSWSELVGNQGSIFLQSQNIGRAMELVLADTKRLAAPDDADADRAKVSEDDVLVGRLL
jgi:type I restriction enzyme, S subunit